MAKTSQTRAKRAKDPEESEEPKNSDKEPDPIVPAYNSSNNESHFSG